MRLLTRTLCARFPDEYWRAADVERRYPQEFVDTLTHAGLLSALIPVRYGGLGLDLARASVIMEEINRSGGHSAACHAQMYTMGALLRHGREELKQRYLPRSPVDSCASKRSRSPKTRLGRTRPAFRPARQRDEDQFVITGAKNWTSRISESDLALVLARTTDRGADRTSGLTLFLIDLRQVRAEQPEALQVTEVRTMFNYATNSVVYDHLRVPADHVIGEVDLGFRYVIDGWNAERILLAAEAVGDGYWFIERAVAYANRREVFGRKIGANQGVQFPIVDAYMKVRAADMMRYEAFASSTRTDRAARRPTWPNTWRPRPAGPPRTSASIRTAAMASSTSSMSNASSVKPACTKSRRLTTT